VGNDRVLVVVELAGGNDGLNTVIPVRNDLYYGYRPQLGIDRKVALRINDNWSFHPSLRGLKSLYDEGLVAIVQGVGYPNPRRSHFKGMEVWHTASLEPDTATGWIGRYFDSTCGGGDHRRARAGMTLTCEVPRAMRGEKFLPVVLRPPGDRLRPCGGQSALAANASVRIENAARDAAETDYPPRPLSHALRTVARMIVSMTPTRVYYVRQQGYDTHVAQARRHQQLLGELGAGLKTFVDEVRAAGELDRVVVMTFSEFGRQVAENASGGTDHGQASVMLVIGRQVRPGFHGEPPSLENLHRRDLGWTTDFRGVYAAMLGDWLGAGARPILGEGFQSLPIIGHGVTAVAGAALPGPRGPSARLSPARG